MKRKEDFVTNSSSTSFVISTSPNEEQDENVKANISIEVDLLKYSRQTIKTEEDLKNYIKECCWDEEEMSQEALDILAEIKKGNTVYILEASDDNWDDPIETLLCYKGLVGDFVTLPEGITILRGEGGY